jgi:glycogen debranching enzyme
VLKDSRAAADYGAAAVRAGASFSHRFWYPGGGYLYDVIDGPADLTAGAGNSVDASLRPNQIFAVSLGSNLLDAARARAVVEVCARELLTPVGLRSLATSDPRYAGRYAGDPRQRDAIYHQGTVWSWLLGPYVLAHHRVYGDTRHALALLEGLAAHLDEACSGSISEIMDGDAPHSPRGCFAQAWSVAETLRAYHTLTTQRARTAATQAVGG